MTSPPEDQSLIVVEKSEEGSRLDRFLVRRLGTGKRPLIMRLIRKGNVRVNRKRARPQLRLRAGDAVFLPQSLRVTQAEERRYVPKWEESIHILYEDEDFLIVNKPSGKVVHSGSGYRFGLIDLLRITIGNKDLRLGHRLDRDTSGCLLLVKNLPCLRKVSESFRTRRVKKTYLAWVLGWPNAFAGVIHSRLQKGKLRSGERMVVQADAGKEATTFYQVIETWEVDGVKIALMALKPESGRTHQLRVQLAWQGHPILGDGKYAEKRERVLFRKLGVNTLMLHAWKLKFPHPFQRKSIEVCAPIPEAWKTLCKNWRERLASEAFGRVL